MSDSEPKSEDAKARGARALVETRHWLDTIVVGLNLCPFAKAEFDADRVRLCASPHSELEPCLVELQNELWRLDQDGEIATTLVIYPEAFADWDDYLDLTEMAEQLLVLERYEGIYQLASFHPDYQFADTEADDPANLTNRSPYPMLHVLREADVERSLAGVAHPESIPARNQALCRRLGADAIAAMLRKVPP